MYLFINTASSDRITVALAKADFLLASISLRAHRQQSEKLLPAIEKILNKNKTSLKKLKGIIVVSGPGSFTSLRIGIAAANTLAYSLAVPVVGAKNLEEGIKKLKKQKKFKIVLPFYGKKPNITTRKQE